MSDQCCHFSSSSVRQSLDELDFERGIWSAALNGELDRIKVLLQKGIPVDTRDSSGYTALHYAVRTGNAKICEYLLFNGADINARTKAGQATPIHRAATAAKEEIVKLLITKGADLKLQDTDGKTVLHRAAEIKNVQIVKELLDVCPDLKNVLDIKGYTALSYVQEEEIKKLFNN